MPPTPVPKTTGFSKQKKNAADPLRHRSRIHPNAPGCRAPGLPLVQFAADEAGLAAFGLPGRQPPVHARPVRVRPGANA